MSRERLAILWDQYLTNQMSPDEKSEFQLLASDPGNQPALDELAQSLFEENRFPGKAETDKERIFQQVMQTAALRETPSPIRRIHFFHKWGWIAASVLLMLTIGAYLFINKKATPATTVSNEILPGKDGAILTLANGSQVFIDSIQNGVVALQGGVTVKVADGKLLYEGTDGETVYNTMSTPKGRQFHLILPDGTKVWMNAASSIRYPTVFREKERRVQITGEVYFEVAKNANMPFRLQVNNKAAVEVLGTKFNVNAYENEESINTTLIEGAVKVGLFQQSRMVTLKPGQQAQCMNTKEGPLENAGTDRNTITVVKNTDIDKVMAWKNGLFIFDGANLFEIMRQMERWYDIEVMYEKGVRNKEFMGKLTKDVTLQQMLEGLSDFGVHYKLEGRKLTLLP